MRLAILSDIHGNAHALDLVLDDLRREPVDQIVCLGDAVQGGPQPAQVVRRLRELACPVVMGNADAWLLDGVETGGDPIPAEQLLRMGAVREWSLAQLSAADRDFISRFAPTVTLTLEAGRSLLCFHGSPASFDDLLLPAAPEAEFQRLLGPYADRLLTGGHTHAQQVRRIGEYFFFNPGSVGLAYGSAQPEGRFRLDPWAEYALLTSAGDRLALEFRRVPFERAGMITVYAASGRPHADEVIAQYQPD